MEAAFEWKINNSPGSPQSRDLQQFADGAKSLKETLDVYSPLEQTKHGWNGVFGDHRAHRDSLQFYHRNAKVDFEVIQFALAPEVIFAKPARGLSGVRVLTRTDDFARIAPKGAVLRSSNKLNSVERATPELLDAIRSKGRTIKIVQEGSEEARYLDFIGAEANVGGETMTHILLRQNPGKAAALEEFLHGTQHRLGLIERLGTGGAERHVKDFMIRHRKLLGLGDEDVDILRQLMEAGL